jgi:hypothetical protein
VTASEAMQSNNGSHLPGQEASNAFHSSPLSLTINENSNSWDFSMNSMGSASIFRSDRGIENPVMFAENLSPEIGFPHLSTQQSMSQTPKSASSQRTLDINEARLVRHYAQYLAPWVSEINLTIIEQVMIQAA